MKDIFIKHYSHLGDIKNFTKITNGLINQTYLVTTEKNQKFIFQQVAKIFSSKIHEDIFKITSLLQKKNIITPLLVNTKDNTLYCENNGNIYRVLTYVAGQSFDFVQNKKMAFEAGKLLSAFHIALQDENIIFKAPIRPKFYSCDHYYNLLMASINKHASHDYYKKAYKLFVKVNNIKDKLRLNDSHLHLLKIRTTHGDPKISNFLFDEQFNGLCLVDLDTVNEGNYLFELADALRSIANPHTEDDERSYFDVDLATSFIGGYKNNFGSTLDFNEYENLYAATFIITLNLAIRFLIDTLEETYFAFDNSRFSRAAPHNFLKATCMLNFCEDVLSKQKEISCLFNNSL